jgi:hypothetical protein
MLDDLLNPIHEVAGRKIARASCFTAYNSYTFHILPGGVHRGHQFHRISCSFLHVLSRPTAGLTKAASARQGYSCRQSMEPVNV